jgi:hypothetical protein
LNRQAESIKFTMEIEDNNNIPFLDILISKKNDGSLSHQVYRKKTHTDRYLHVESHHHPAQKLGVINTLVTCAIRVSDNDHVEQELNHLVDVFKNNGYKEHQFKKVVLRARSRNQILSEPWDEIKKIMLPYIKGTTDKITRILKKGNIRVIFTPPNTLKDMLDCAKDIIDPKHHKGVYTIPCSCGKDYIGETGRSLHIRLKEHCTDIKHNWIKRSALAEHSYNTGHLICIENAKIIAKMSHYGKKKGT